MMNKFQLSSSIFRLTRRTLSTVVETKHVKHRTPIRRASKLLNELKTEAYEELKNGRQWPDFRTGDAIEIDKLPFMTSKEAYTVKGVVIGISKKASDTNVKLLNVISICFSIPGHVANYLPLRLERGWNGYLSYIASV